MKYFAHILNDFMVEQIIVISDEDCGNLDFPDSEPVGQEFIANLYNNDDLWLQTSMDGSFRGNPAVIGGYWDPEIGQFKNPPVTEYNEDD
jgi:hypothetical protein